MPYDCGYKKHRQGPAPNHFIQHNHTQVIDINDAVLAATAMQTGGRIYTLNVKHYPMSGVLVKKAW
jgi:predicted nucleic acid-binding protein